ncbi:hypothetical protein ACS0TY_001470 [Phlomoides rotata]
MSRCTHSELRASDSQDLGRLDSFSLPSEPPDIRNWYSSYVYESPELNTLDGFHDFDGSGETFVEDGKNTKSCGDRPVGKFDDALVDAPKKPSDGMRCNESDEFTPGKSYSLVIGSSDSLSFTSEPPDIKEWFSSYIYESPTLDSTLDFAISDYKESEDGKLCNVQMNCRQDKKDVALVGAEENIKFYSQRRHPNVFIKCTNLVKDPKLDYQSVGKDVHNVVLKPMPSTLSQLTCDKVSDSSLSELRRGSNNQDKDDDDENLHFNSTDERSPISLKVEKYTGSLDGESLHMPIGRIEAAKEKVDKEDLNGNLDFTVPRGDSSEWASHRNSCEKENELPENGFISIRKKSCEVNAGHVIKRVRVDGVELKRNQEKDAKIVRKVLSEISNFSTSDSKGKWQCPQKNKPELGPPLKQLRLDQWFNGR